MTSKVPIKIQTVSLLQKVEDCYRISEVHLEKRRHSLPLIFQFTNLQKKRKDNFVHHLVILLAAIAQHRIFRLIIFRAKVWIYRNAPLSANRFDQRRKRLIRYSGGFDAPIGDQTELFGQNITPAANDQFLRGKTFFADSLSIGLSNLADRMAKFNAVRIDYAEYSRYNQKLFSQLPVCFQATKQRSSPGNSGNRNPNVTSSFLESLAWECSCIVGSISSTRQNCSVTNCS